VELVVIERMFDTEKVGCGEGSSAVFRFSVRQSPLPGRYGVWDSNANDWYSDWTLSEPEANRQATDLDVIYDFYGERKPRDVRQLDPPRPVNLYGWQPAGELDVWVRDDGQWWGRVRDEHGLYQWHRATDLQPATTR
jgi:hypothetical protein